MKQIILILLLLFLVGCQNNITGDVIPEVKETQLQANIQLNLDKDLYRSNEVMDIDVSIDCNKDMENMTVRVYGINSKRNRLDLKKNVDLVSGDNQVQFDFRTPSCNRCSGITAGTYSVNADVSKDGEVLTSVSREIEIQQ